MLAKPILSGLSRAYKAAGAPVRIKLRTPMLLRFPCNFVRLKDDLQLLNVPQTCASLAQATARILNSTCAVERGLGE